MPANHHGPQCSETCNGGGHYDRGDISVKARHKRVRKLRGKATEHSCNHCGNQARDWATIHGHDGYDPQEDYIPLCRPCHRKYDRIGPRQARAKSVMAHAIPRDEFGRFLHS